MSFDRRWDRDYERHRNDYGFAAETRGTPGKRTLTSQLPVQRKVATEETGEASQGLPAAVQDKMEHALDADFSNVRVHVGDEAPRLGALAFTRGTDVFFAPGQYDPGSERGQRLIGHELAHVVQQREGRVSSAQGKGGINGDPSLEAEADRWGDLAAAGQIARTGFLGATAWAGPVQRMLDKEVQAKLLSMDAASRIAWLAKNAAILDANQFYWGGVGSALCEKEWKPFRKAYVEAHPEYAEFVDSDEESEEENKHASRSSSDNENDSENEEENKKASRSSSDGENERDNEGKLEELSKALQHSKLEPSKVPTKHQQRDATIEWNFIFAVKAGPSKQNVVLALNDVKGAEYCKPGEHHLEKAGFHFWYVLYTGADPRSLGDKIGEFYGKGGSHVHTLAEKNAGNVLASKDLGNGDRVTMRTGVALEDASVASMGEKDKDKFGPSIPLPNDAYALDFTSSDPDRAKRTHWLQFIWREIQIFQNGRLLRRHAGKSDRGIPLCTGDAPLPENLNVDSGSESGFYDDDKSATKDIAPGRKTIYDEPGYHPGATDKAHYSCEEPDYVLSIAHMDTFLVEETTQGLIVRQQTSLVREAKTEFSGQTPMEVKYRDGQIKPSDKLVEPYLSALKRCRPALFAKIAHS